MKEDYPRNLIIDISVDLPAYSSFRECLDVQFESDYLNIVIFK